MDYNEVNKRILELCKQRNWSQYKLAQKSNIPTSSINAMFKYNHVPTIYSIKKICDAFQITLVQFFDSDLFYDKDNTTLYNQLWNELSPDEKEKVLIYMHGLLNKEIRNDLKNDL